MPRKARVPGLRIGRRHSVFIAVVKIISGRSEVEVVLAGMVSGFKRPAVLTVDHGSFVLN